MFIIKIIVNGIMKVILFFKKNDVIDKINKNNGDQQIFNIDFLKKERSYLLAERIQLESTILDMTKYDDMKSLFKNISSIDHNTRRFWFSVRNIIQTLDGQISLIDELLGKRSYLDILFCSLKEKFDYEPIHRDIKTKED